MAGDAFVSRYVTLFRTRPFLVVVLGLGALLGIDFVGKLATGAVPLASVATFLWDGIVLGFALGLAGIGLSMTYSILTFANFAHGDLLTSGAFAGWIVAFLLAGYGRFETEALVLVGGPLPINTGELGISVTNTPLAVGLGLLVAVFVTAVLALVLDRIVFKPMREESGISLLIASVGVALALRYLLVFVFKGSPRGLTAPQQTPRYTLAVGDGAVRINAHEVTLVVLAGALMVGTHVLLRYTKLGTSMRAMADNEDLARISGIPTERVITATWLLGGGLTGAAGFLIALEQGTGFTPSLGWGLLLLIFAAVILGGIGSVYGAMVGGLVIGIASRLSLVWIPESFILVAAFAVMIVMLLVRPSGLFGGVTTA